MLRESLRRLLAETDAVKLPVALEEFGWLDLLGTEPGEAVGSLFEVQGEMLAASPMLGEVMAVATRMEDLQRHAVVVPGPGARSCPGSQLCGDRVVEVHGFGLPGAAEGSALLVPVRGEAGVRVVRATTGDALVATPVEGFDPWLGLFHLEGRLDVIEVVERVDAWDEAVVAGRRALAHELIGVSRAMLALAVDHVGARRQFGRVIGTFQAVKHRLAEAKVALSAAEAAATEAWTADPADADLCALLAKLWAGRAARTVGRHAQQVLGGMGFTWEHPFHRHFRRALVLDSLLGSTTELASELGHRLVASGEVPRLAGL
jgi:hypothetical protein